MRENADQNNSEYGHFLRSVNAMSTAKREKGTFYYCQKQPSRGVLRKRCSENMLKYTVEHPCGSAISIKLLCNSIEIALRHGCSPVNLLHIFRITFSKNTSNGLLLYCHNTYTSNYVSFYEMHAFYTFHEIYLCFRILIYLYEFILIFVFV